MAGVGVRVGVIVAGAAAVTVSAAFPAGSQADSKKVNSRRKGKNRVIA